MPPDLEPKFKSSGILYGGHKLGGTDFMGFFLKWKERRPNPGSTPYTIY
jgi:hypothetical protein